MAVRREPLACKLRKTGDEMTRPHVVTTAGLSLAAVLAMTAAVASGAPGAVAGRSPARACPVAGRAELNVPAAFDEVRVVVAGSRPGAASAVTVLAGNSDRVLT